MAPENNSFRENCLALESSLFQLSPCSPNLLASVALTLPLPQEFFLFCRFPWDARRKGRFLGLCGPLCPCAWLVDSGFSLNTTEVSIPVSPCEKTGGVDNWKGIGIRNNEYYYKSRSTDCSRKDIWQPNLTTFPLSTSCSGPDLWLFSATFVKLCRRPREQPSSACSVPWAISPAIATPAAITR